MPRLTIRLSDERHLALKEAAAKRRQTMGELIAESLDAYGIKSADAARALVAAARRRSGLSDASALGLAMRETRASRRG